MRRFLVHWLTTALALGATAWVLPGVYVSSLPALGLANAVVKPLLLLLTLPLGLFYLVVNGLSFAFAALLVPGFSVRSFGSAMLGALLVGAVSWFIGGLAQPQPTARGYVEVRHVKRVGPPPA